ncbi:BTAD domain-containing putative transcriptional regulator [Micromonospora sp. DT31]|uniref:BTAD domain-containing putative transcriptional regulator n=1 Tax=Micromonospora sp. DT31 TaxID=3393434 RepID=UPI003CF42E63
MEIEHERRLILLNGVKQRATLGYLLLHANEAVATSQLLTALWGHDQPATVRKMLQNAVSNLRRMLPDVELETRPPGYALRVSPADVDALRFQDLAQRGRAELASGAAAAGAATLRSALRLWRGPVLADLAEDGVEWPELAVLNGSRLNVLEDCFEAELAAGRHFEVVSELVREAEAEPARERLCGQLILALYRCGRQVDALAAYRRTRAVLADQLGLDPSRELRDLERCILNHDPVLAPPTEPGSRVTLAPQPVSEQEQCQAHGSRAERKPVSALLVRAEPASRLGSGDLEEFDEAFQSLSVLIREEAERFGGTVHGNVASVWVLLFGVPRTHEDDAQRAIRAGLCIRDRIRAWNSSRLGAGLLTVRAAVATGEALATYVEREGTAAVDVAGGIFLRGDELLASARADEVRVCDTTRQVAGCAFGYVPLPHSQGWAVELAPTACSAHTLTTFVGREREMILVTGLLDDARRRRHPHLVTLLGEPGIGKSRLVIELCQQIGGTADPYRYLVGQARPFGDGTPFEPLADLVRMYAGIGPEDDAVTADEKLTRMVGDLFGGDARGSSITHELRALLGVGMSDPPACLAVAQSCRALLEEIAGHMPLAVVLEDLHQADDRLLDFIESLADWSRPVPLVVLATARPQLRHRRPEWGGGEADATTVTLNPLSTAAINWLVNKLIHSQGLAGPESHERQRAPELGGNPLFALEYVRMLQEGVSLRREVALPATASGCSPEAGVVSVPHSVYTMVSAQLDRLPGSEKAVLQVAALLGGEITATRVASLAGCDQGEAQLHLEALDRKCFLQCVDGPGGEGERNYGFRDALVRNVSYSQIPRSARPVAV